jgi:hypothetical protein
MKYYIKRGGSTPDDAFTLDDHGFDEDLDNAEILAEVAAEDYHHNHDGWESRWPIVFTLILADGATCDVSVDQEAVPTFCGTLVPGSKRQEIK